jgi:hypothetical protein
MQFRNDVQRVGAATVELRRRACRLPIRAAFQLRFAACSVELLEFLSSARFRIRPSLRAVRLVLAWQSGDGCRRAARKFPTRQIANAMAGAPELKWRSSLDRCVSVPCHLHARHATEGYYRRLYKID